MKRTCIFFSLIASINAFCNCDKKEAPNTVSNQERARLTLDSLYRYYSYPNTNLLRENYPFDESSTVTYLASAEQANSPNRYSYLWPYSGTFSAVNALFEATKDGKYRHLLDTKTLPGLEEYFDQKRNPSAYASYINTAPLSDRFYDDNVWLGIDFTDTYMMTGEPEYLDKAKLVWTFVASGIDDKLDGGIYWCEQKKESKNTCSNAPGSVFALKLFEATKDSTYFYSGKGLYDWTKKHLQDTTDYLYYDNVRLDGKTGKAKFAYNSGQMMQSAALLYKLTKDEAYLAEAQNIAKSCYDHFFRDFTSPEGERFKLLKKGDVWFTAVMLRGFVELYRLDNNKTCINAFARNLDYAWTHARDENGLFNTDWCGEKKDGKKWLLTQAAMVEMYARMATIK
ncbi:MAG: glycoside hydrolase family 76 protein [Prevotella sp.]|jgi:rhamnogalacturonyl hydrolase YesR|nr:glycoside hydrolase family 76 protein [Prevotella sp.]